MSYAVLFAGQASQHAGMLPWLENNPRAAPMLQVMAQHVGTHWRSRLQDPTERSNNAFAQCLITGTSLAAWQALRVYLAQRPAVVAGYSVGELAAFSAAGIFDADTALVLAAERARLMDLAAHRGPAGGLLSVSGMATTQILSHCRALQCAIHIDEDQAIYGGDSEALELAQQWLTARGALCKRLAISVASHTTTMRPAAIAFADVLAPQTWRVPTCPVVVNVSGSSSRHLATLQAALAQQIATTVQWAASMDTVLERGVRCVIEIGAGHALATLWNRRHPGVPARALEDFKDAQGAAAWIQSQI